MMEGTRRFFLKIAGISLLGFGARPVLDAFGAIAQPKFLQSPESLIGKRWAMVINLKNCKEDCRDCIDACHKIHNVPDFKNKKDEVKWIWIEPFKNAFPGEEHRYMGKAQEERRVLVLCNHCDNPPCVRVCPTKATWKREDGIVMMDYHRCIGCRFCMAGCPFGARSLNWRDPRPFIKELNPDYPTRMRGVVEKCTFCYERLAQGKIPACVEACRNNALIFGDLEDPNSEVRKIISSSPTIRRKPHLGTMPQVYYIM